MKNKQNLLLLLLAAVIALVPLTIAGDFDGTDDQATQAIGEIRPDYKPWFSVLWEPSEEMEPFLFALQAALGAGFMAYFAYRCRRRTVV